MYTIVAVINGRSINIRQETLTDSSMIAEALSDKYNMDITVWQGINKVMIVYPNKITKA